MKILKKYFFRSYGTRNPPKGKPHKHKRRPKANGWDVHAIYGTQDKGRERGQKRERVGIDKGVAKALQTSLGEDHYYDLSFLEKCKKAYVEKRYRYFLAKK